MYTQEELNYLKDNWKSKTIAELAIGLGKTVSSVRNRLWRMRLVDTSDNWTNEQIGALRTLYSNPDDCINLEEFAKSIGRLKSNVSRKAKSLGLQTNIHRLGKRKPLSELCPSYQQKIKHRERTPKEQKEYISYVRREAIRKNGHPRGFREIRVCPVCGLFFEVPHSSPDIYCGKQCARRVQLNSSTYTRGRGGRRADLGNQYFRSSYEANYARYLNFLMVAGEPITKWEFEVDTFEFEKIKKGTRSYTPDFKLHFKDGHIEYHEVKGWDYPKGKTARKRFAKYYPQFTLILIDSDWFKAIKKQGVNRMIEGWE